MGDVSIHVVLDAVDSDHLVKCFTSVLVLSLVILNLLSKCVFMNSP